MITFRCNIIFYLKFTYYILMQELEPYDYEKEYPCSPFLEANHFTKLMYLIINERNMINGHEVIKYYLQKQKKHNLLKRINNVNSKGVSALMIACRNATTWSSIETVKLLIKYGADVNHFEPEGSNCLILSSNIANDGYSIEVVEHLLKTGAKINQVNKNGETALFFTLYTDESSLQITKLLFKYGINPDIKNNLGFTHLHKILNAHDYAFVSKNLLPLYYKYIKILLKNGADPNIIGSNGMTPFNEFCMGFKFLENVNKKIQLLNLFLDYGANPINSLPIIIKYINCNHDDTIFYEIIDILIKHGANINYGLSNTPLHLYFRMCETSFTIVQRLIEAGSNVNSQNDLGNTALMVCFNSMFNTRIYNKDNIDYFINVLNLMIDNGYDINLVNNENKSLLILVSEFTRRVRPKKIITYLLSYGADPNIKDSAGKTFLDYIKNSDLIDIQTIMVEISSTREYIKQLDKNIIIKRHEILLQPNKITPILFNNKMNPINFDLYIKFITHYSQLLKYYNITDYESFQEKITNAIKYIDTN
ncbi:ankyrin repeat protein [Cotonvirus japonicus]|uniref:Ankyrin repeat protein n=1 Tax=Cotonvirus japonicus TaxID=2811091 RepID=A0ABM7NR85_9VIRU|nr:ankyrin repeat protein [Cotonvirus japonicus]BCS82672.1 ankyrin repeat protein [Cotonvirus japonicus]